MAIFSFNLVNLQGIDEICSGNAKRFCPKPSVAVPFRGFVSRTLCYSVKANASQPHSFISDAGEIIGMLCFFTEKINLVQRATSRQLGSFKAKIHGHGLPVMFHTHQPRSLETNLCEGTLKMKS